MFNLIIDGVVAEQFATNPNFISQSHSPSGLAVAMWFAADGRRPLIHPI